MSNKKKKGKPDSNLNRNADTVDSTESECEQSDDDNPFEKSFIAESDVDEMEVLSPKANSLRSLTEESNQSSITEIPGTGLLSGISISSNARSQHPNYACNKNVTTDLGSLIPNTHSEDNIPENQYTNKRIHSSEDLFDSVGRSEQIDNDSHLRNKKSRLLHENSELSNLNLYLDSSSSSKENASVNVNHSNDGNRYKLNGGAIPKKKIYQIENNEETNRNIRSSEGIIESRQEIAKNPVVIIEPLPECSNEFFKNPLKTFRILQSTLLNKENVIECTRNIKKKIQVFKLRDESHLNEILKLENIGHFRVKCYQPFSQRIKIGLIGPIELEISEEEMLELLLENENEVPVYKVERLVLGKKENKRVTKTMKLFFEATELPEEIIFLYENFKVSPYIDKPWQCYNCQKFGHNANNCPNKTKCVICSGLHKFQDCPNKENKKCANCGGSHTASFGGCQKMKQQVEVQKIKVKNDISYREAVKLNMQLKPVDRTKQPNSQRTYAQAANGNNLQVMKPISKGVVRAPIKIDAAVQTVDQQSKKDLNNNEEIKETKLALCMLEILNLFCKTDKMPKKIALISKAFETHLGIKIDKHALQNAVQGSSNAASQNPTSVSTNTKNASSKKK